MYTIISAYRRLFVFTFVVALLGAFFHPLLALMPVAHIYMVRVAMGVVRVAKHRRHELAVLGLLGFVPYALFSTISPTSYVIYVPSAVAFVYGIRDLYPRAIPHALALSLLPLSLPAASALIVATLFIAANFAKRYGGKHVRVQSTSEVRIS